MKYLAIWLSLGCSCVFAADTAVIGSKIFTEGYILGEIAAQVLETASPSIHVTRKLGMGSTGILYTSLNNGAIDVYSDYTGTLAEGILKNPRLKSWDDIHDALQSLGLTISRPLGFNNTYALAMRASFAEQNQIRTISDLVHVQDFIRLAFSYEFMNRADGYRGLIDRYGLKLKSQNISRMEHSLTYRAIEDNAVDAIEIYSTDAKIKQLGLRVLRDDRDYFPSYQAVWVARTQFVESHPDAWQALRKLEGQVDEPTMRRMNAQADIEKVSFREIAARFLGRKVDSGEDCYGMIWERTLEHLRLVGVSMLFSILIGIPLGGLAVRFPFAGQAILLTSALIQTIPSLALLCFLIPLFGVGTKPALVALCLYSLLPVVLNTFTGIRAVDAHHLENARAFGLNRGQILFRVILPLSSPTLLAGVKTATIVSIGTATLAALIGAGGYGAAIVSGLALNDVPTILTGAIPAAAMALLAHAAFEVFEWILIPAGLRARPD